MGRVRSLIYFWGSTLFESMGSPLLAKLTLIGSFHLIHGRNPISFCNVLFTANIIAGFTLLAVQGHTLTKANFKKISLKQWGLISLFSLALGAIIPTLIFYALMLTEVINVVLIFTLDIPLALIFGWLISKDRPNFLSILASLFALCGVVAIFLWHQPEELRPALTSPIPRLGEICAALGTTLSALTIELIRRYMKDVSVGIFNVYRMFFSTFIFFIVVIILRGFSHFADIFSPFLWKWMLVYGGLIIAGDLYLLYTSLPRIKPVDISFGNAFSPIAGILFAFLILGEIPDRGQLIGGFIILVGITFDPDCYLNLV